MTDLLARVDAWLDTPGGFTVDRDLIRDLAAALRAAHEAARGYPYDLLDRARRAEKLLDAERALADRLAEVVVEAEISLRLLADRAYGKADGHTDRLRVLGLVRAALSDFEAARGKP